MTTHPTTPVSAAPLHLVVPRPWHGVTRIARQVAEAVGAPVCDLPEAMAMAPRRVHVHVTDQLFGDSAEEAADTLAALTRHHRVTLTLHDVPQPEDGTVFPRRVGAYAAAIERSDGWVVSSHHEARLVREHLRPRTPGMVVPLPVLDLPGATTSPTAPNAASAPAARRSPDDVVQVALLGWVYPGKGHAEVVRACARLSRPARVLALGQVAAEHQGLGAELADLAHRLGVGLEVSGWVEEDAMAARLGAVDVAVAAHRKVSASGSINSWLAAGRRPVVLDGPYTREMARLRPGTLLLADDEHDGLVACLECAAAEPALTWLAPGTVLAPRMDDVARAYLRFWARPSAPGGEVG